jgi:hypothetical protein
MAAARGRPRSTRRATGHVYLVDRKRGPVWYAKYRPPAGLLPYLEPAWRSQLAHAVGHVGLIGALRRIGGRASTVI